MIAAAFAAWMLVGFIVVEACRLWRTWWVKPTDLFAVALWPYVLFFAFTNGPEK